MFSLKSDRGFIFSVDATLAILISLIAVAGVASVGSSTTSYEQHGALRLHRINEDTIIALTWNGTFENALKAMEQTEYDEAERIIRENLKAILPKHIQFRLTIGKQLTVYPTDSAGWNNVYENAKDRIVSNQLSSVPSTENFFRLLTWVPEQDENQFVENISGRRPLWYIEKCTNETNFRENIKKQDENGVQYEFYDAVFIPDADIQFSNDTIEDLKNFSGHGRLIVAGDTLWQNQNTLEFYKTFGLTNDDPGDEITRVDEDDYSDIDDLYIRPAPFEPKALNHPIIVNFAAMQKLRYEGEHIYYYESFSDAGSYNDFDTNNALALACWGYYPEAHEWSIPWLGPIINDTTGNGDPRGDKVAVFINANIVQNNIQADVDSYEWYMFTIHAISGTGGYPYSQKPIKLSLWKGEGL